jgi:ketosteroid isomerase-like protein
VKSTFRLNGCTIFAGILIGLVTAILIETKLNIFSETPTGYPVAQSGENGMSDEGKIRELLEQFVESWNANDAEHAALVYTDPHFDVNATPQDELRQTTVEKFARYFSDFDTRISVTSDEIIIFGDYALQRGQFTLTSSPKSGGNSEVIKRRYVEVLRKDNSGNWSVYWGIDGDLAGDVASELLQ